MIKQNRFFSNIDWILALLCGLVPFFWFEGNELLKAEDVRLPYTWEKWKALFYVWHHGWNTGSELIFDNCLMPMMFLPALLQEWGLSLLSTEKIIFVFWYTLAGLGMIYLLRVLYKGPGALAFRIGGLSFYLFNLWLENVWIGFKPPLITAYALIPFLIALSIQIFRGEIRFLIGASLYFLLSFFASGMGNNPSELGATFAPILIVFLSFFIRGKAWKNFGLFKILFLQSIGLLSIWLVANAYWLFPQAMAIYRNVVLKMSGEVASPEELISWLKGMSLYTNFSNVLRTVADWTWYQGCVDPYRSYSASYAPKTFLYALSWLVPIMAFIGCWNRSISYKKTFIVLTLSGLFLSMGAHPPLGFIYIWLTQKVPLFWIFRSPYLKFYFWVCLGYTVLFGAACHLIYQWCGKKKLLGMSLVALLSLSNLVYAFPITTGKIFHDASTRKFLSPNRFEIPDYVFKTADWLNQQPGFFRYFTLPGDNPYLYTWGGTNYGSFANEFSNKNLAFAYHHQYTLTAQGPINQSKELLELIRNQIYTESTWYTHEILSFLQVKYLLQEKDIRYDFYKGFGYFEGDSPEFIQDKLSRQKGFKKTKSFGAWDLYQNKEISPFIYGIYPENTLIIEGNLNLLTWWSYKKHASKNQALFFNPLLNFKKELPQSTQITSLPKVTKNNQIVLSTSDLTSTVYNKSKENQHFHKSVSFELAFTNQIPHKIEGETTWIWWDGNKDAIYMNNKTDHPVSVNFSLRVFSLENPRSFYVYRDKDLLKIFNLPASEPQDVLVENIELQPGKNKIHFYSPYQHSNYEGHGTSFGLDRGAFAYGRLTFDLPLEVTEDQKREIRLYAKQMQTTVKAPPHLHLNKNAIKLKLSSNGKKEYWEGTLDLAKGKNNLTIEQRDKENYFVELSPKLTKTDAASIEQPNITTKNINPTRYQLEVEAKKPFVLVFSESFHPYWKAYTLEKGKKNYFTYQSKVNGFANGFIINKAGKYTLWLEFSPQKWFDLFLLLTLLGLLTSLLILLLTSITRFKNR